MHEYDGEAGDIALYLELLKLASRLSDVEWLFNNVTLAVRSFDYLKVGKSDIISFFMR